MLCFVSAGLIYKASLPGFSPFCKGNSVRFFSKICSSNGSDPMGVRGVAGGIRAKVLRP